MQAQLIVLLASSLGASCLFMAGTALADRERIRDARAAFTQLQNAIEAMEADVANGAKTANAIVRPD